MISSRFSRCLSLLAFLFSFLIVCTLPILAQTNAQRAAIVSQAMTQEGGPASALLLPLRKQAATASPEELRKLAKTLPAGIKGAGLDPNTPQPPVPVDTPFKRPDVNESGPSEIEKLFNRPNSSEKFNPRAGEETVEIDPKIEIQQFGYNLFGTGGGANFNDIPPGPEYVIGPGDALTVSMWGKVEEQLPVTVDNAGQVTLPKVGVVQLAGVRYGDLERVLKRELSRVYVNFELSAKLTTLRSIQVFVLGEVPKPGAYRVSSMATLVMALYQSGGITKLGSLRKVQLIRGKQVIRTLDLYSYLLSGDRSQDPLLRNFDTIFVPVIGEVIGVSGLVKRPGIYEIKHATTLQDAITTLAGGYGINYYGKRLQIERIVSGKKRVISDFDMSGKTAQAQLKSSVRNGDLIRILPISNERFNEVSIEGNVGRPGSFEYAEGMTLGDLLSRSDDILPDTYLNRVEIYRKLSPSEREIQVVDLRSPEGRKFKLHEFDIVKVFSREDIYGAPIVKVTGEVESPGQYKLMNNMRLLYLVYQAKPLVKADWHRAELIRQTSGNPIVIPLDLETARSNPDSTANIFLQAQDELYVRRNQQQDLSVLVTITGAITYPGTYVLLPGETLKDLVIRAGGFTPRAFLSGMILKRKSVADLELAGEQKILAEEKKRFVFDKVRIDTLTKGDGKGGFNYASSLDFLSKQLSENQGRIVLEYKSLADLYNRPIALESADTLYIPEIPASVQIVGGVGQSTAQLYKSGLSAQQYIETCGGFSTFANPGGTLVVHSNGNVERGLGVVVERGDTIYVPEEIKAPVDWLQVLTDTTRILANIATTVLLFQTVR